MIIANKKVVYLLLLFLFTICPILKGQTNVISSKSSYILIRNDTTVIADNDLKTPLPFIIAFPVFDKKRSFISNVDQINVVGKIKNPEGTKQLFFNRDEVKFSGEGLFFKILNLSPGKNILRIRVIPKTGKITIVHFFVTYESGEH